MSSDVGVAGAEEVGRLAEEVDRLEVLAAAVAVRHPLAGGARVVAVEHRGDSVDPQPVDVELVDPVHRRREQERAHLVPAVVEDQAAPVGMPSLLRIVVLVQRRAVEACEPMGVVGEVRRHPVEDHADAPPVEVIDEPAEVVGRAVARRRGEEARHLVAPRAVERMLHHRQQLDVGEAERAAVVGELRRELAVGEHAVALLRHAPPRAQVHLVDRQRLPGRLAIGAGGEPVAVRPLVRRGLDDRRVPGRQLGVPRRSGRSSRARDRPACGSGTCTAAPGTPRERTPPRLPRSRSVTARRPPSHSSRRRRRSPTRRAPRPRTRRRRLPLASPGALPAAARDRHAAPR